MLISYLSEDIFLAKKKAIKQIKGLLNKHKESFYISYNSEEFSSVSLDELVMSNALFKNNYIVLFDNILNKKENKLKFFNHIESIAESKNVFFLVSDNFTDEDVKLIKKYSYKIITLNTKYVSVSRKAIESKEVFKLTDALEKLDVRKAWLILQDLKHTHDAHQVYGSIWWFLKKIKNKKHVSFQSVANINDLILHFLDLPANVYKYNTDLFYEIEKWILSLRKK